MAIHCGGTDDFGISGGAKVHGSGFPDACVGDTPFGTGAVACLANPQ